MTVTELSKKLKLDPKGVYLFYGEEEYLKRRYLEQIREKVIGDDPAAAFNHVKITGGDLAAFSAELDGLPLLGGERLIELWDTDFSKVSGDLLESLCARENARLLRAAVERCLTEQERQVVCMRYGLFGQMPRRQREVAQALGISRSYVSRIEKRALEKLRSYLET